MYQETTLIGNLGGDPEMKYTQQGKAVCTFTLAVSRGKDAKPAWFRVTAWEKQAEICKQYLSKGKKVFVKGTLAADENGNPRTFTRKDGTTGASFEITAQVVRFLDPAGHAEAEPQHHTTNVQSDPADVPF